jgi:GxxExxY protein
MIAEQVTNGAGVATAPLSEQEVEAGSNPTGLPHGETTGAIIGAFYEVYNALGYGFAESVYLRALALELYVRRIPVVREVPVHVLYKGVTVGTFRAGLIVEDAVVVEIRAGEAVCEGDRSQLLNYLRCSAKEVGLLLHFGPRPVARRVSARQGVSAL